MNDWFYMKISSCICTVLCVAFCSGCSVREDRSLCPCRLIMDFSEVDLSVIEEADMVVSSDEGFIFNGRLGPDDFIGGMSLSVPRKMLDVGVWSGTEGLFAGDGMIIPEGEDCPRVYFHLASLMAEGEAVRDTVLMRKNHCVMTLNLEGTDYEEGEIVMLGNVNGYMEDGSVSVGEFVCGLKLDGSDGYEVVLPRQTDNSLVMEINDGTGVLKRFAIGEFIAESGYDWEAADLEDIEVDMDFAVTGIELKIQGWDKIYEFVVVI